MQLILSVRLSGESDQSHNSRVMPISTLRLICTSARCPFTVIRKQIGASLFFHSFVFLIKKRIEK